MVQTYHNAYDGGQYTVYCRCLLRLAPSLSGPTNQQNHARTEHKPIKRLSFSFNIFVCGFFRSKYNKFKMMKQINVLNHYIANVSPIPAYVLTMFTLITIFKIEVTSLHEYAGTQFTNHAINNNWSWSQV